MNDAVVHNLLQELWNACANSDYPNAFGFQILLSHFQMEYFNFCAHVPPCNFPPPDMAQTTSLAATELLEFATDALIESPNFKRYRNAIVNNKYRKSALDRHDAARKCTDAYEATKRYATALSSIDTAAALLTAIACDIYDSSLLPKRNLYLHSLDIYACCSSIAIDMARNTTQDALVSCLCGDVDPTNSKDIARVRGVMRPRLIRVLGSEEADVQSRRGVRNSNSHADTGTLCVLRYKWCIRIVIIEMYAL